jgi:hypothetical protein
MSDRNKAHQYIKNAIATHKENMRIFRNRAKAESLLVLHDQNELREAAVSQLLLDRLAHLEQVLFEGMVERKLNDYATERLGDALARCRHACAQIDPRPEVEAIADAWLVNILTSFIKILDYDGP